MCTGSNSASVRTSFCHTAGIGSNLPGQVSGLCGQASQVAACGSHSAGQRYPGMPESSIDMRMSLLRCGDVERPVDFGINDQST